MTGTVTKRGQTKHPLYNTWRLMVRRCCCEEFERYSEWGGRGIAVCNRWLGLDGFSNFCNDMGERPDGCTLDRKNNDQGYFPGNCRWATRLEQQRNRKTPAKTLTYGVITKHIPDWAKDTGLYPELIHSRLRHGWTVGESLGFSERR